MMSQLQNVYSFVRAAVASLNLIEYGYYHIGFWAPNSNDEWVSVAGDVINTELFGWGVSQPDGGEENVAVMYFTGNIVHDYPNTAKMHFICEKRLSFVRHGIIIIYLFINITRRTKAVKTSDTYT